MRLHGWRLPSRLLTIVGLIGVLGLFPSAGEAKVTSAATHAGTHHRHARHGAPTRRGKTGHSHPKPAAKPSPPSTQAAPAPTQGTEAEAELAAQQREAEAEALEEQAELAAEAAPAP